MTTEHPKRRTARVRLDPARIASLIGLPEGCRMVAVDAHNDPLGFTLIVESPDFPEVDDNVESPHAHCTVARVSWEDENGDHDYTRITAINVPTSTRPEGFTVDCQSTWPDATCRVSCLRLREGKPGCS